MFPKCLVVLFLLTFQASVMAAGDPVKGEQKSILCASCHGEQGIGLGPLWPNLAGQKFGYLAKQMRDFRDGRRSDPMMEGLLKELSDEDIDNLAAYYAQLNAPN